MNINTTGFINARLVLPDRICENAGVLVQGGKIVWVGEGAPPCKATDTIDVAHNYLSPGLIDIHVHGGGGHDFMDGTPEAFEGAAAYHSAHGVTSMYPTTTAGSEEETLRMLETFNRCAEGVKSCNLLGVHLEGPYFSFEQRGAQDERYIMEPNLDQVARFLAYGCVKRWSIAPELPGALELGSLLHERGIIASIAHTNADFDTAVKAVEHGYRLVTHLYSGMSGVHRKNAFRHGGVIEAGLLLDELYTEIIADNCHLPKCLLQLICKCKGADKVILISDAMRGAGYKNGESFPLGSLEEGRMAIIEDDVAKMPDREAFAGSIASGDRLLRTMIQVCGLELWCAIAMITVNPAILMGIYETKGSIEVGKDADLIIFDENIDVKKVMIGGNFV